MILVLGLMLSVALLSAGWIWLCFGVAKQGVRKIAGLVALQITILVFLCGLVRLSTSYMVQAVWLPPMVIMYELLNISQFTDFISSFIVPSLLLGGIAVLFVFSLKPLRLWSVFAGALVVLISSIYLGEDASKSAMCVAARDLGTSHIYRHSLLWSLQNAPTEFQWQLHALAEVDGQRWGWSYRELHWYKLSDEINAGVDAPLFECSSPQDNA